MLFNGKPNPKLRFMRMRDPTRYLYQQAGDALETPVNTPIADTPGSGSGSAALKIVQSLRSFDAGDADFFLELLSWS